MPEKRIILKVKASWQKSPEKNLKKLTRRVLIPVLKSLLTISLTLMLFSCQNRKSKTEVVTKSDAQNFAVTAYSYPPHQPHLVHPN